MPNVPKTVDTPAGPLTAQQDAFVDAFIANGAKAAQAAIAAGYAEASAHVRAHRLLKKDAILSEIYRRSHNAMALAAPAALQQVIKLASGAKSERIRMEASQDLLDRTGFKAPDRLDQRVSGDIKVSIDLGV